MTVHATPAMPAPEIHLPAQVLDELRRHFSPMRVSYIARVLSADKLRIIGDLGDALIIARIEHMEPHRLANYDRFVPVDAVNQRAYAAAQMEWLHGEHYLLGTRLGRSPTHAELQADFAANRNGQRFRAYYVMKHPGRMRPTPRGSGNGRHPPRERGVHGLKTAWLHAQLV